MSKSSTYSHESDVVISEDMLYAGLDMYAETKGRPTVERVALVYAAMEAVRQLMLAPPENDTIH